MSQKISDEKVLASTGKAWDEWFKILDAAGAAKMNHKEIVTYIGKAYQVKPWWQQMVTVTYEQERGMRALHQKPEGYEISVSKTIDVSLAELYNAFEDERARNNWQPDTPITIHKATPEVSMRITWTDGQKSLNVNFYDKGQDKSQVVVQHTKLPDAKGAEKMKAYWAEALERLKQMFLNK
ncbi:MAG: hypothetical protein FVQ77_08135 [Cytophagales bacterium]|nr:hypothetical protein [Cytophagales bacterium]